MDRDRRRTHLLCFGRRSNCLDRDREAMTPFACVALAYFLLMCDALRVRRLIVIDTVAEESPAYRSARLIS